MTINELRIQLDLHDDKRSILNHAAAKVTNKYLFVDSEDGQCYLFDKDGNQMDISNLEQIEDEAFSHCTFLTRIKIPNSVKSIGDDAFYECTSLKSIQIPDSVKNIGNYAFEHCTSLINIQIPNSVENIGYWAFYDCTSLISIKIPDSVENIGSYAFENCKSLTSIKFKGKTLDEVKAIENYPWGIKMNQLSNAVNKV